VLDGYLFTGCASPAWCRLLVLSFARLMPRRRRRLAGATGSRSLT
jgi:hypothetical protein